MDTCESTSKLVDTTYKNVVEELGPCIKQMVVAGRTYLKSIYGMVAANKNYTDALSRIANLADNSTLRGSSDIGAALHHLVDINKEIQAQESNIMKSLEFDFLEPMEIAADKDTKLVGREQKRFQQLHKGRKEAFEKSIATLKKSRRKKSINTDKQLAHIKLMENTKTRLEEFCDESLKEAIVQERMMYGTVLERQCVFNKQLLIYHNTGCELLQDNLRHWEGLAETRDVLPPNCFPLRPVTPKEKELNFYTIEGAYHHVDSPAEHPTNPLQSPVRMRRQETATPLSGTQSMEAEGIYARPMMRAKSEYSLASNAKSSATLPSRFSRIVEYNGETPKSYVRALYPYLGVGEYQLHMDEGNVIEYKGPQNTTGWQFGDNLTTKRCGWFPLSYTEAIANLEIASSSSSSTIVAEDGDVSARRRMPPQLPDMMDRIKGYASNQSESSDYGTLRKMPVRKPLPVEPPITPALPPSLQFEINQRSLHRQYLPSDRPRSVREHENGVIYSNIPLQSMHL